MTTHNMEFHQPQAESHITGVTAEKAMTLEQAIIAAEADGANTVHVAAALDGVTVVSKFDDYTRIIEITPEGAFVRTI